MRGRTIVITSGKGGVGKSTVAANLGAALALRGRRVLLIDCEVGMPNLDVVLGVEDRIVYNLAHVVSGACLPEQGLIQDPRVETLYLISASPGWDVSVLRGDPFQALCERLKEAFDYVLIDSPDGIEEGFRATLVPADQTVLVATPGITVVRNADRVLQAIAEAEAPRPDLVLNRVSYSMVRRGDLMSPQDVVELLSVRLLGLVPDDDEVLVAANRGVPSVFNARSRVGRAFRYMAARLEGDTVPLTQLDQGARGLQRLWSLVPRGLREERPPLGIKGGS